MKNPTISIVCALDTIRAIGKENALIWHIPEDLKHFKQLTVNHPVIMGRRTYESIGKLLADRTNIIVTRNENYEVEGAIVAHTLEDAIAQAKKVERLEIFIIGGSSIYEEAIKIADKLYLTLVAGKHKADAYFPDYSEFRTVLSKRESSSEKYHYTFLELVR